MGTASSMVDSYDNTMGTVNMARDFMNTMKTNASLGNFFNGMSGLIDQTEKTVASYKDSYESLKNTTQMAKKGINSLATTLNKSEKGKKIVNATTNFYNNVMNKAQTFKNNT